MAEGTIELLGSSQTFLGVLATVIILCIFKETKGSKEVGSANESNNFIYKILEQVRVDINKEFESLSERTSAEKSSYLNQINYKKLQDFIAKTSPENVEMRALRDEGMKLNAKVSIVNLSLQKEYVLSKESPLRDNMDVVKDSNEQIISPLYSFIVCILVFIFDELLRIDFKIPNIQTILLTNISIYLYISYMLWVCMWWVFFKRTSTKSISKQKSSPGRSMFFDIRGYYKLAVFILFVFLPVIGVMIASNLTDRIQIGQLCYISSITIPIILFTIIKFKNYRNIEEYPRYLFSVNHAVWMFIASVFISLCFYCMLSIDSEVNNILFSYNNGDVLRISILMFVLLNGLVLPFLCPYLRYRSYLSNAKKYNNTVKAKEIKGRYEIINTDIDNFLRKIK